MALCYFALGQYIKNKNFVEEAIALDSKLWQSNILLAKSLKELVEVNQALNLFHHVAILGLVYAILNGVFHVGFHSQAIFFREAHHVKKMLLMMIEDILGILLFMYLLARSTPYLSTHFKNKKL